MDKGNKNNDLERLGDLFARRRAGPKPPAYPWQDLALRVIAELSVPGFKRNSIFQICRNQPPAVVEIALNDTKELCLSGEKWKYFLKIIGNRKKSADVEKSG